MTNYEFVVIRVLSLHFWASRRFLNKRTTSGHSQEAGRSVEEKRKRRKQRMQYDWNGCNAGIGAWVWECLRAFFSRSPWDTTELSVSNVESPARTHPTLLYYPTYTHANWLAGSMSSSPIMPSPSRTSSRLTLGPGEISISLINYNQADNNKKGTPYHTLSTHAVAVGLSLHNAGTNTAHVLINTHVNPYT